MEFKKLIKKAKEIKGIYKSLNRKQWNVAEYTQGLVGDMGDLMKLVMAKDGFREIKNIDEKLKHELSDCLWSILIIADELGINLEKEFMKNMDKLKNRLINAGGRDSN